ncbi:MAG: hypothetical protein QXZ28_04335 [Candidatus Methanomethylicaceae archaeon]
MSDSVGETENWRQRTYGILPEGAKVKTSVVDTKNYIEYGEKTWTTGQTVRDILQNHLDANTQRYFDQLVSSVIDTEKLTSITLTEAFREAFDEFSYTLFRYRKGLEDLSPQAEAEFKALFDQYARALPLRTEHINADGTVKIDSIRSTISAIKETPPQIRYCVVDRTQNKDKQTKQWVDWQEIQSPVYLEQINTQDEASKPSIDHRVFRFQIIGVQILDEGYGFDSKLNAFYKSTKTGKRHLRGKFGEGTKMSETHLVRNGAKVKMRSAYHINEGENRDRVWQQRPYVGDDKIVKLQTIEVDIPHNSEMQSGSYTIIDIQDATPEFQEEFISNIDPRIQNQGLAINCLEYSNVKYYYPIVNIDRWTKPVGVSLEADPQYQYVQGLRVGEGRQESDNELLFSYDFLDSSILKGRDRSELKNVMFGQIKMFWQHAESPELLEELIRRSLLNKRNVSGISPEFEALRDIIDSDPHYLNAQAQRTRDTVLQIMPRVLGIEQGRKNVIVSDYDLLKPDNRTLLQTLEAKGYHIVKIANIVVSSNYEKLNEYHKGQFEVYTLDSLRKNIDTLVGHIDAKSEKVHFADTLYKTARENLQRMIQVAGLGEGINNLLEPPTYLETVDPKTELPIELTFDQESQMFRLIIRPDLILAGLQDGKGIDYWQRRIQVEMLAALGRREAFPDRNTALMQSQENAQELLDKTLHSGMADVDALPDSFNHRIEPQDEETSMKTFTERLKNIEKYLLAMVIYDKARRFQATLADLETVAETLSELPSNYKDAIEIMLKKRVVIENGEVGFFRREYTPEGGKLVFTRQKIEDLDVVATLEDGRKVYRVDNNRLFVLQNIPDGSVVKMNGSHTYVAYKGKMLNFEKYHFGEYKFDSFPLTLDRGCLSISIPSYKKDFNKELRNFEKALSELTITSPERGKSKSMKMLKGIIETPLPIEYGVDEWDNPIRVFEDIVQNHIDAAPDGKVDINYEVIREGKRVWVTETTLTDSDQIVGLAIMDKGEGYLPDDLGTMGKSSKKSPMFAGKYGEGQKMISAAAVRNGLSLSFTSLGEYNGEQYRWTAQVGTRDEELIVEGKRSKAQRVVFNLNSEKIEGKSQFTSATLLRLPDTGRYNDPKWQKWLDIFDPRKKDERGNGGLSRYVINLRKESNPNVIDLGYMRILLDEPGVVYENGLLISRESGKSVVGYDVPEVVTTRERNAYDPNKLRNYIAHAMRDCRDLRYTQIIMREFEERYLKQMIENPSRIWVREEDLDFGRLFFFERGFLSSKPLWDYAYATELGSYLIHSDEALKSKIKNNEKYIKEKEYSPLDKEAKQKEIERARTTLANIVHIPKDHLIQLSKDEYDAWARIFPTAEEYVMSLAEQRIPVNEEVRQQLTRVIAASGSVIRQVITKIQQEEETNITYMSIISEGTPNKAGSYWVESAKQKVDEQLAFWSDYEKLLEESAVFVAPANSGYLGLASKDRVGLNERLLVEGDLRKIVGTARHELLHKIFGIRDYTPEFIMLLLELVETNIEKVSYDFSH